MVNSADQIQELRTEVAQLKELLANAGPQSNENPSSFVAVAARDAEAVQSNQTPLLNEGFDQEQGPAPPAHVTKNEISDPKERSPRGYYRQHTLFRFFDEVRCCGLPHRQLAAASDTGCRCHNYSRSLKKLPMNFSSREVSV